MKRTKIGIIGCGNISGIYCKAGTTFSNIEIAAVSDIDIAKAEARAAEFGIPRAISVEAMLADPEIEIVVNLTVPAVHAAVDLAALEAGKHVYSEKPLAVSLEDAKRIIDLASEKDLRVGCAPDTFLGAGYQTCRKLIDDGWIGEPLSATAFMLSHGPDHWHPNPNFFYQTGGGPMMDMGPYYLTGLVTLLGAVRRVAGATRRGTSNRMITKGANAGKTIPVEVETHLSASLDFASNLVCTICFSFDVWAHELPFMQIYGTEGTLSLPDPNRFDGPVRFRSKTAETWTEIPLLFPNEQNSRGIGISDMAHAIESGREHRASGSLAYHVLEIMDAIHESSRSGQYVELQSSVARPAPLPLGLIPGRVE